MKKIRGSRLPFFALLYCCSAMSNTEKENMDDFFSMSPAELSEISVSIASGTAKPISRSAAVTSVITADQIKSMGATELHEILETVPGLHVSLQEITYDYIYTMRGIRNKTNSQVLILLDGQRFSLPFQGRAMTGLNPPVENIQRVEVIRGPGSALYGADAFAGVINIITKQAKDIDGTTVAGRAGSQDTQSIWGQHGGQWAGWDVAASLQYQHTNGDDGRIIGTDSQTAIDTAFSTSASHAPGPMQTQIEQWHGHLNLQRKHWDIGFWAVNINDAGTRAGGAAALDPKGRANGEQYMGDIRFSTEDWFEDWQFSAHASYLYSDFRASFQLFPDNAVLPIGSDGNINFVAPVGISAFPEGMNDSIGRVQQMPELELSSIYQGFADHRIRLSAGFRYEDISTTEFKNFGPGVINGAQPVINGRMTDVTDTPFVYLGNMSRSIWSTSLQDEWQINQDWQMTAGVRYDYYSDFGNTVNPRFALVWNVNEQFTSKLLYGRAFRAPSFSEQGNMKNPVLLGNPDLDPETINTVELAFDYRPWKSFRSAVNLYYYAIADLIEAVPNAGGTSSTAQNNGDQTGYGLELEWNWQLHEQFIVNGNYAWQYTRNELTGRRVAGVPEHQVYAAAVWHFLPQWSLQTQIKWIGGRVNEAGDNRDKLDDYEIVDVTLRTKKLFGHLDLAASVRNVFNTNAREPAVALLPEYLPLPGRSFYVEAGITF